MTVTDDALVRDLVHRAARAQPAMALDVATVLAGGRRYRRRRTSLRGIGAVATAALAVAVVQALPGGDAPPAGPEQLLVDGLTIASAVDAVEVATSRGPMYDLDLPRDAADPDGGRYVLDATPGRLGLRPFDPSTGAAGELGASMSFTEPPTAASMAGTTAATIMGVADEGVAPELLVDGESRGTLPTFTIPEVAGSVFVVRIWAAVPGGDWPMVAVRFGTDADGRPLQVSLGTLAASAVWSPTVVEEFDTEHGPALELGGPGLPGDARSLVLVPEPADPGAGSSRRPLATLRTDREATAPLATLRWPAGTPGVEDTLEDGSDGVIVDDVAYLVGVLPAGADRAVVTVGDTRVPLGTFSMPSLPGRWAYVAVVDLSDVAPGTEIAVEYHDDHGLTGGWVLLP